MKFYISYRTTQTLTISFRTDLICEHFLSLCTEHGYYMHKLTSVANPRFIGLRGVNIVSERACCAEWWIEMNVMSLPSCKMTLIQADSCIQTQYLTITYASYKSRKWQRNVRSMSPEINGRQRQLFRNISNKSTDGWWWILSELQSAQCENQKTKLYREFWHRHFLLDYQCCTHKMFELIMSCFLTKTCLIFVRKTCCGASSFRLGDLNARRNQVIHVSLDSVLR